MLLANDCPFVLSSVRTILRQHFSIVHTVENGADAVEIVTLRPGSFYSAIVLDIDMPVMDGIEACEKIVAYFKSERERLDLFNFDSKESKLEQA